MSVESLPDFTLDREVAVGALFLERGTATFREAARYVQNLPYPESNVRRDLHLFGKNVIVRSCPRRAGVPNVPVLPECEPDVLVRTLRRRLPAVCHHVVADGDETFSPQPEDVSGSFSSAKGAARRADAEAGK